MMLNIQQAGRACRRYRRSAALFRYGFCRPVRGLSGGGWHMFNARNNTPRIRRMLITHRRDTVDMPIGNIFGPNILAGSMVWMDEVVDGGVKPPGT